MHPEHGRRLHWLENVSDQALTEFYEACLGVFIASYNEGFGLPVVEAATHGRWALVRDVPVFREQRLPSLRYFSDDSPEALSRELLALVRTAEATPPPATALPKWSRCVRSLVEEIGLEWDNRTESTPALRLVS